LSEIRVVSFGFPPRGWALCNGQLLPINQNQALFSLLGTTYGGDGRVNFALPDLRGRVPIHFGSSFSLGQRAGQEAHTLTISEMPEHIHFAQGSSKAADQPTPGGNLLALVDLTTFTTNLYAQPNALIPMAPSAVSNVGGSQPHENRQPYLVLNFIIALQGVFPSQN
jgi:microcystin-dependent protein